MSEWRRVYPLDEIKGDMEAFVIELGPEEELLRQVIEPLLASEGYELVRIRLRSAQAKLMLTLFVDTADKKNGVVMDNLVDMSRLLSDVLDASFDEKSILKRRYDLEVSSPGLDRPLTKASHFRDAVGEKIKLRLKSAEEHGLKGMVGILREVSDEGVKVENEAQRGEIVPVGFKEMAEANVIFDFANLHKNKRQNDA